MNDRGDTGESRRLDGLDEILTEVAAVKHEANNALMGLVGHAELLLLRADLSEDARNHAREVSACSERLRELISRLDKLTRGREKPPGMTRRRGR